MSKAVQPRIYVVCLASYNAGKAVGTWINATMAKDEIEAEIQNLLATTGGTEWAIHDHEGFKGGFKGIRIGEHDSVERVSTIAQGLVEHGEPYAVYVRSGYGEDVADFEDAYQGTYDSVEEYVAGCYADQLLLVPEPLRSYIDLESLARDMETSGEIWTERCDDGVMVFTS